MRDARALCNMFLPVASLPPEVLEKVFVALSYEAPLVVGPKRNGALSYQMLGWIVGATHVCRAWRRIAVGCPRLWANIALPTPGRGWTDVMFSRAGYVPLNITVHGPATEPIILRDPTSTDYEMGLVRKNLPRTKSLRFTSWNDDLAGRLLDPDVLSPLLQQLDITVKNDWLEPAQAVGTNLGDHTPALRELRLSIPSTSPFLWTAGCLRSLTTLEVVHRQGPHSPVTHRNSIPMLEDVVEALRRMVSLEKLTLGIQSILVPRNGSGGSAVQLTRLAHMDLTAPMTVAQCLMERLEIPQTATLRISVSECSAEHYLAFVTAIQPSVDARRNDDTSVTRFVISAVHKWSSAVQEGWSTGMHGTYDTYVTVSAWRGTR
ncbi:hypothetical protein FA95DRAFT_1684254 [Auriscalpium vulgare]|uniref:Uncharacterized protein n=1 Tax=Auriscalpium vulgare TaxID=40419 RepID=A0ACB8R6F0_9AGAM|nr:hypothetical protein FA95DRAFT_1684254 [Auriscalpium vulgare]